MTPSQGEVDWDNMIKVNGAYKPGRHYTNWLKSLRAMSKVKVYATQDGWPAGRTRLITEIHLILIRIDQEKKPKPKQQPGIPVATLPDAWHYGSVVQGV